MTYLRGWPQAKWWASPLLFWDDFSERRPAWARGRRAQCGWFALPAAGDRPGRGGRVHLRAGLAFPESHASLVRLVGAERRGDTVIGNHYCQRFRDAWQAAEYTAANLPSLEKRMRQFLTAMRETTLPAPVKDAAMANLSTLATPTCFRTADGKFRGFEGLNDTSGCCHGNCTHVWNYETATQHSVPHARALACAKRRSNLPASSTACCRFVSTCPKGNRPAEPQPPTAPWARSSRPTSTGGSPATTPGCATSGRR